MEIINHTADYMGHTLEVYYDYGEGVLKFFLDGRFRAGTQCFREDVTDMEITCLVAGDEHRILIKKGHIPGTINNACQIFVNDQQIGGDFISDIYDVQEEDRLEQGGFWRFSLKELHLKTYLFYIALTLGLSYFFEKKFIGFFIGYILCMSLFNLINHLYKWNSLKGRGQRRKHQKIFTEEE